MFVADSFYRLLQGLFRNRPGFIGAPRGRQGDRAIQTAGEKLIEHYRRGF